MSEETPKDEPDIKSPLIMSGLGLALGLAPWPSEPLPHLVQKIGFLLEGTLYQPMDIFDLFLHGTPGVLAVIFWIRYIAAKVRS